MAILERRFGLRLNAGRIHQPEEPKTKCGSETPVVNNWFKKSARASASYPKAPSIGICETGTTLLALVARYPLPLASFFIRRILRRYEINRFSKGKR